MLSPEEPALAIFGYYHNPTIVNMAQSLADSSGFPVVIRPSDDNPALTLLCVKLFIPCSTLNVHPEHLTLIRRMYLFNFTEPLAMTTRDEVTTKDKVMEMERTRMEVVLGILEMVVEGLKTSAAAVPVSLAGADPRMVADPRVALALMVAATSRAPAVPRAAGMEVGTVMEEAPPRWMENGKVRCTERVSNFS
jgi:hypothetical protein